MGYDAIRAKRILQDKPPKLKLSFAGSTSKPGKSGKMEPARLDSRNGTTTLGVRRQAQRDAAFGFIFRTLGGTTHPRRRRAALAAALQGQGCFMP